MKLMNKKGQMMPQLNLIGYGLISFAILIGIGILILYSFGNSVAECSGDVSTTTTVLNETGSVNNTGYQLLNGLTAKSFSGFSIIAIQNVSAGQQGLYLTGTTANYTLNASGWLTNTTTNPQGFYRANITYSYTWIYTHTWNKTTQTCLNDSYGDAVATTSTAYGAVNYMQGQLGTSGLAGWTPAILALSVGLLFLGAFLVRSGKSRKY